ncbi:proliferating cell nuclear antigen, PCNA [Kipferlia bialata]|uniref:DNA sliding clamp PCNA n=1 Tax=Kipferlia bialata TaxID=797122 RepID=A0A9K3GDW2_9EUKA|nr:proliferating cell nuclear antigen, PCNA [Kipferlia bialata]|eukprot:g981.t1
MFEAHLEQASTLKKMIEAVKGLVNHVNINCNEQGMSIQAIDTSHVALVYLKLRTEGFALYNCEKSISLGISMDHLSKILKSAANNDTVIIRAEDEKDSLHIIFQPQDEKRVSTFELKLLDIDIPQLVIPVTEFTANVTIASGEFQRICRDLNALGENVSLSANKEGMRFSVDGETASGSVLLQPTDNVSDEESGANTVVQIKTPVEQSFPLRYMLSFAKATPISDIVTFEMADDIPLAVTYPIEGQGFVKYFLAPKIDGGSDDEGDEDEGDDEGDSMED